MKTILLVVTVSVLLSVAFGSWLEHRHRETLRRLQAEHQAWAKEKAELEALLAKPASQWPELPATIRTNLLVQTNFYDPATVLERLRARRTGGADHVKIQRRIVQDFENLTDAGNAAIPPIRSYLACSEDVEYSAEAVAAPDPGGKQPPPKKGPPPGKGPPNLAATLVPASLRAGLFEVLQRIGTPEAEQLLVETLSKTSNAREVLQLARLLEAMRPGQYRDLAASIANSLLAQTPVTDRQARKYLTQALEALGEQSSLNQLRQQLLNAQGEVDMAALELLQEQPGPDTLPLLLQALNDPRVTKYEQQEPLVSLALRYVGTDPGVDQMFFDILASEEVPMKLRSMV
jgi:hypothetical protein